MKRANLIPLLVKEGRGVVELSTQSGRRIQK